jgi:hypothetical protein
MSSELHIWFEAEGLMRYAVEGGEQGEVVELSRAPVIALGPRDEDFVWAPDPAETRYPGKPLRDMTLDDYNVFMYRWFEAAVHAGAMRCANCGKPICDGDDLPDPETWDAILIEKEIVAWMVVHFDCKRWLAKKLKGLQPFELHPRTPPTYDLSQVSVPDAAGEPSGTEEPPGRIP